MNKALGIRLDIYVARESGYARTFAAEIIKRGLVAVDGKTITKPGEKVHPGSVLTINPPDTLYVGRGGYKLEFALNSFSIDLCGKICADIGASTGGFTDCMLQRGASKVYSIDNGHGQLADSLRSNPKVAVLEDTNIKDIRDSSIVAKMDFIAVDVSFVSIIKILNAAVSLINPMGEAVFLIKPQFEAGPGFVGKSGIVRDPRIHKRVIENVGQAVKDIGLHVCGVIESPVRGKEGNIEFLMYCSHNVTLFIE